MCVIYVIYTVTYYNPLCPTLPRDTRCILKKIYQQSPDVNQFFRGILRKLHSDKPINWSSVKMYFPNTKIISSVYPNSVLIKIRTQFALPRVGDCCTVVTMDFLRSKKREVLLGGEVITSKILQLFRWFLCFFYFCVTNES